LPPPSPIAGPMGRVLTRRATSRSSTIVWRSSISSPATSRCARRVVRCSSPTARSTTTSNCARALRTIRSRRSPTANRRSRSTARTGPTTRARCAACSRSLCTIPARGGLCSRAIRSASSRFTMRRPKTALRSRPKRKPCARRVSAPAPSMPTSARNFWNCSSRPARPRCSTASCACCPAKPWCCRAGASSRAAGFRPCPWAGLRISVRTKRSMRSTAFSKTACACTSAPTCPTVCSCRAASIRLRSSR